MCREHFHQSGWSSFYASYFRLHRSFAHLIKVNEVWFSESEAHPTFYLFRSPCYIFHLIQSFPLRQVISLNSFYIQIEIILLLLVNLFLIQLIQSFFFQPHYKCSLLSVFFRVSLKNMSFYYLFQSFFNGCFLCQLSLNKLALWIAD